MESIAQNTTEIKEILSKPATKIGRPWKAKKVKKTELYANCFARVHMHPIAYWLWNYARTVSHESRRFYLNGARVARDECSGISQRTLYGARDTLIRDGWFRVLQDHERTEEGRYSCGVYYPLSHEEWVSEHPGQCRCDAVPATEAETEPAKNVALEQTDVALEQTDVALEQNSLVLSGVLSLEERKVEREVEPPPSPLSKNSDLKAATPASPEPRRQGVESDNPVNGRTVADEYADFLLKHGDEFPRPTFRPSDAKAWKEHKSTRLELLPPLLKHIRDGGVTLTEKQQRKLKDVLFATSCSQGCLLQATNNILEPLDVTDSFEHAGSKLVAGLLTECQAVDRDGQTSNGPHVADELAEISKTDIVFGTTQRAVLRKLDKEFGRPDMVLAFRYFMGNLKDEMDYKFAAKNFVEQARSYVYVVRTKREEAAKQKLLEEEAMRKGAEDLKEWEQKMAAEKAQAQVELDELMKDMGADPVRTSGCRAA